MDSIRENAQVLQTDLERLTLHKEQTNCINCCSCIGDCINLTTGKFGRKGLPLDDFFEWRFTNMWDCSQHGLTWLACTTLLQRVLICKCFGLLERQPLDWPQGAGCGGRDVMNYYKHVETTIMMDIALPEHCATHSDCTLPVCPEFLLRVPQRWYDVGTTLCKCTHTYQIKEIVTTLC